MNEIVYTLVDRIPPSKLYAEYKGRKAKVFLELVPAVFDAEMNGEYLFYEKKIKLAQDYLKTILYYPNEQIAKVNKE